jgi:tol-pal system protein YbgF
MTMRHAVRLLLLGTLAAGAMGCAVADTGAFGRLSEEVGALRKEVAAMKGQTAAQAGIDETQGLRKTVADLGADSDRIKSEQLAGSSRLDETQAELRRVADRQAEEEKTLQEVRKGFQDMDKRVAALEGKAGVPGGAPIAGAPPAPPAVEKPSAWKSPEEMYEYSVGQVKAGSPKKGRETLAAFVAQNPGHKLVPNALYWKGESYYAEKDYENAILSFQDVVDKYPAGDKAPDAVYKQGLSFLALQDRKNAKILFNLVVSKYPKSPAADLAKKKLAEIK